MDPTQKVLIVDDDRVNVNILTIMVQDAYDYRVAYSGEEALEIAETYRPDIVLLDIMMPGIDGYEVCRQFRADEKLARAKILLLTAKSDLDSRLQGYDIGADDYVSKPFEEEELLAKVRVFERLNREENKTRQLNRRLLLRQQDIPSMLWECDDRMHFTWVDTYVEGMLGYSPDYLMGKSFADFVAEQDVEKFLTRFEDVKAKPNLKIQGMNISFVAADGSHKPLKVFADRIFDDTESVTGFTGILRDMSAFAPLLESINKDEDRLSLRIDENCRVVEASDYLQNLLDKKTGSAERPADLLQFLVDSTQAELFPFYFAQKEDIPFPIEIRFEDEGHCNERLFAISFSYSEVDGTMAGMVEPIDTCGQIDFVSQKLENQEKKLRDQEDALKNTIVMDSEMQEQILTDANNLTSEILQLVKNLEAFAFPESKVFNLEEFKQFLFNRNLQVYSENLRLLGNKIHGLKGSCGFLMNDAKQICHKMEDITRPLAEHKLVLTDKLARLLKQFVFKIEDMLEQFLSDPGNISAGDWLERIAEAQMEAESFMGDHVAEFEELLQERSIDAGEIRKARKEDYLSVSNKGYETLAEKAKDLYYSLSSQLQGEQLIQAGNLYNQFFNVYQEIKKVPLDLSRYERLIPKLAKDYEKDASFIYIDHHVQADREFWNAIHEILNHVLKNAVIHGIELPERRQEMGKDPTGKVEVELREDALNIELTVRDDGKGIDRDKVLQKALYQGAVKSEQVEGLSESEILNLLFIQGVSTAENLDDNAGRGVGMNAVQEAMNRLGGTCVIKTEVSQGSSWTFSFPKSNVSLPCVIVTIGRLNLAIPEDFIETFVDYKLDNIKTVKQSPAYNFKGSLVPLIDVKGLFNRDFNLDDEKNCSVLILKHKAEMLAMVFSTIMQHTVLPIQPVPKIYREIPLYQGISLYNNEPIQVINVESLV